MQGRHLIYAAFTVWLLLILFMAIGVHALWSRMVKPVWVAWALLPGTIVCEMAYIFGCLITGGEIRRAKILPGKTGAKSKAADGEPGTESTPRLKVIGPILAALFAVIACIAGVVAAHAFLGEPVIKEFIHGWTLPLAALPDRLPASGGAFWDQLRHQASLLQRMTETLGKLHWLNWRVPLFVYLTICFSIRLAPVRRDLRYTLASVLVITGAIALAGAVSPRFANLVRDVWPLLTYIWTVLLFLLIATLLLHGLLALFRVLAGKSGKTA